MERLTKISEIGNAYYPKCFEEPCCGMGECLDDNCSLIIDACKKLAEYEQLEEQGLLVRLPVPLGYKVYWISTRDKQNPIIFEKFFTLGMLYFWNSTVFATREEAAKKLEEMKNDKA